MTRVARTIAGEEQVLCERCGYVLSGLPAGGRCPECGMEMAESDPALRREPAWEDRGDQRVGVVRFLVTTAGVMFWPGKFYRGLATRAGGNGDFWFAMIHWGLTALLVGGAMYVHARWFMEYTGGDWRVGPGVGIAMVVAVLVSLAVTTAVAGRLTHWEATYRGLRMPMRAVRRALYYHAAHYVPVGVVVLGTVLGYRELRLRELVSPVTGPMYLYVLCGEVIAAAAYLFKTYWTGMRNIMYANR